MGGDPTSSAWLIGILLDSFSRVTQNDTLLYIPVAIA